MTRQGAEMGQQSDLLSWIDARRKADAGMNQALDHADRVTSDWSGQAFEALLAYCEAHDQFTAEEARAGMHALGLCLPPDGRAWGGVFKRAAKRGRIRKAGYAPRRCGNMTPTIIWETA